MAKKRSQGKNHGKRSAIRVTISPIPGCTTRPQTATHAKVWGTSARATTKHGKVRQKRRSIQSCVAGVLSFT